MTDEAKIPEPAEENAQAEAKNPNDQSTTDACPVGECGSGPQYPAPDPNGPQNA